MMTKNKVEKYEDVIGKKGKKILPGRTRKDIVGVASSKSDFSTLVAAIKAAGLVSTLQGEGPFTVFAPTNEAFDALPDGLLETLLLPENRDVLTNILTYHVVPGKVMSSDVSDGKVRTVEGSKITISTEDGVQVNGANVVKVDVPAINGVIHVIDQVIVPPTVSLGKLLVNGGMNMEEYGFFEDVGKSLDEGLTRVGKATESGLERVRTETDKMFSQGINWMRQQRDRKEIEKLLQDLQ
jgi:uncharacterized surface protein with fasciclin (FAS1) repeats